MGDTQLEVFSFEVVACSLISMAFSIFTAGSILFHDLLPTEIHHYTLPRIVWQRRQVFLAS